MKHLKSFIGCMSWILTLGACSNVLPSDVDPSDIDDEIPNVMKEIKFDSVYVQTDRTTWPIAFESYIIEDKLLIINGSFYIIHEAWVNNIDELEVYLNKDKEKLPYVASYIDSSNPTNDIVLSNFENTERNLSKDSVDGLCIFILNIDISPLLESDKLLGELVIYSYFDVFHNFNGESIC